MNQQDDKQRLSTADMVAAGERANGGGRPGGERTSDIGGNGTAFSAQPAAGNGGRSPAPTRDHAAGQESREETPLLEETKTAQFRSHWDEIQRGFVDEPRDAVKQADSLVAEAIQQLASVFAEERAKLEQQWSRGDQVSTDDLRISLQRYRSFFQRLLEV
jgi:hypothetical protein